MNKNKYNHKKTKPNKGPELVQKKFRLDLKWNFSIRKNNFLLSLQLHQQYILEEEEIEEKIN